MSSISYKSCELDPIPVRILRACAASVLPTITNVLTISLETGFIPTVLKETIVEPLPKKSTLSLEDFNNFGPVSNLCFVSNIIEKCVAMQLIKYLDAICRGEVFQFAYKEFHSTKTPLIRVFNILLLLFIIRDKLYFCFWTYWLLLMMLIILFSFHVFQNALESTVLCYNGSTHIFLIAHSS